MGNCKYCGQSAGFLRSQHKECADRHESAARSIKALCVDAALHGAGLDGLSGRIREVAATGRIDVAGDRMTETLSNGWCDAVEASMEDHALSSDEKRGLNRYRTRFDLHENRLDSDGHFELFRMMALLNSLVDQAVVPRFDRRSARAQFGRLPFNLMKSEELLWVFRDVGYIQQVTRREFRGGSMGMSFRVTKGVYVRPGAFRGRSVASKSMEHTDSGMLGDHDQAHLLHRRREELPCPFGEDRVVRAVPGRARNHAGHRPRDAGGIHDGCGRRMVLGQHHRRVAGYGPYRVAQERCANAG